MKRRLFAIHPAPLLAFPIALLAGCGSVGAPAPPSLNLPTPVQNLSAMRKENSVQLTWTMPARTTDRVVLKHPVPAEICRKAGGGICVKIGVVVFPPDQAANYTDHLPPEMVREPAQLLTYEVNLRNRAGKSAGISNPALSAAGPAPPALTGLAAQVRRDGVLLSWHPATEASANDQGSILFRIRRDLLPGGNTGRPSSAKIPNAQVPPQVTLAVRVTGHADPGHALDNNVQPNQKYRYTVVRVATLTLAGHSIEIQGQPGDPIVVSTTDVFPPAVPQGLVAVADAAAGAIDLSWTPDSDADLAGYYVYRRDVGTSLAAQRIPQPTSSNSASSGAETAKREAPIATPAFHDAQAERGHTYAYSVSAIDQNGNESMRSPEVVETLPNR